MSTSLPTLAALPAALARGDDVSWVKLIGFAAIGLFWLIGAAAKALSSKKPKPTTTWTPTPPAIPPQAYAPVAPPPAQWAPAQQAAPKAKKQKKPKQRPAELTAADLVPMSPAALPQTPPLMPRAVRPGVNAAHVRRLLTPAALRRQYIVSELFDPPPSARG